MFVVRSWRTVLTAELGIARAAKSASALLTLKNMVWTLVPVALAATVLTAKVFSDASLGAPGMFTVGH